MGKKKIRLDLSVRVQNFLMRGTRNKVCIFYPDAGNFPWMLG